MAAPGPRQHRFQSQLSGDFREQIRVVPIEAEFFEGNAGRWGSRQRRGAGVFGEGAQGGVGQLHAAWIVGALQPGDDAKSLGVALETQEILPLRVVQLFQHRPAGGGGGEPQPDGVFAGVAERWIADVVRQTGGGDHRAEILRIDPLQSMTTDHAVADHGAQRAADAGHFQAVGQAGTDVVALGEREDLGFVLQPPEGRGEDQTVEVALEVGARFAVGVLAGDPQAGAGEQAVPVHARWPVADDGQSIADRRRPRRGFRFNERGA